MRRGSYVSDLRFPGRVPIETGPQEKDWKMCEGGWGPDASSTSGGLRVLRLTKILKIQ